MMSSNDESLLYSPFHSLTPTVRPAACLTPPRAKHASRRRDNDETRPDFKFDALESIIHALCGSLIPVLHLEGVVTGLRARRILKKYSSSFDNTLIFHHSVAFGMEGGLIFFSTKINNPMRTHMRNKNKKNFLHGAC